MAHEPCWPATCQTESHGPHDRHHFGQPCCRTAEVKPLFYTPSQQYIIYSGLCPTVLLRLLSLKVRQLKGVAGVALCVHVWGAGGRPPLQPPPLSPLQPPPAPSPVPLPPPQTYLPPLRRARAPQKNYYRCADSSGRPARHATPSTSAPPGPAAGCCRQQEGAQQRPAAGQRPHAAAAAP